MKITHLGHACVLVEAGGARILIDPGVFTEGFEQLTDLDAVLITHQHPDHLDPQRLPLVLEANDGTTLLAEAETAVELDKVGIDAQPLHPGDEVAVGGATLTGVGGQHAVIHPDIPQIGNVGVLVRGDGEPTLYHPGDTYEYTPEGVDLLATPLNAPWAKLSETVEFVRAVQPRTLFPIHDTLLKPEFRGFYLGNLGNLVPAEVADLYGGQSATF